MLHVARGSVVASRYLEVAPFFVLANVLLLVGRNPRFLTKNGRRIHGLLISCWCIWMASGVIGLWRETELLERHRSQARYLDTVRMYIQGDRSVMTFNSNRPPPWPKHVHAEELSALERTRAVAPLSFHFYFPESLEELKVLSLHDLAHARIGVVSWVTLIVLRCSLWIAIVGYLLVLFVLLSVPWKLVRGNSSTASFSRR